MRIKQSLTKNKALSKGFNNIKVQWRHLLTNNRFVLFWTTLILLFFFVYLVNTTTPVSMQQYKIGDIIKSDIYSESALVDEAAFELLQQKALDSVVPITTVDLTVQLALRQKFTDFYDHLMHIKATYASEKMAVLQKIYSATMRDDDAGFKEEVLNQLIALDNQVITDSFQTFNDVVSQIMAEGVAENDLADTKLRIADTLTKLNVAAPIRDAGMTMIESLMVPNVEVDFKKTEALKQKVLSEIEAPMIQKGALLANKGQFVTEELLSVLESAGYGSFGATQKLSYGIVIHLAIAVILGLYYSFSSTYLTDGLNSKRILLSTALIVITALINHTVVATAPYLVHVALYTLTMCLFYKSQYAVMISVFLVALTVLIEPVPLSFALYGPLSAVACGLMLKEIHQRSIILYSGVVISLVNVVIGGVFLLLNNEGEKFFLSEGLFLMSSGLFYAILTIGTLPIWEFVFRLITPIKLLELSSPNQPLQKLLLIEAPGTYHHSVIVGNLSDEAARAIGADSMLARVGAYYHDIGKTYKPYFFKENQLGIDNPHDDMSPYMSAGVIKNHVQYGEKLAHIHHLPEEIIGFIKTHHGTTIIKYFYHKALKDQKEVDVKDFSYDGEIPLSKEMAIVMLADTVEAVSRTLEVHNPQQHETMLNKVFQDKYESGQLKDAPLTFADLEKIKKAFLKTLSGLYHDRIVYPEDTAKEKQ